MSLPVSWDLEVLYFAWSSSHFLFFLEYFSPKKTGEQHMTYAWAVCVAQHGSALLHLAPASHLQDAEDPTWKYPPAVNRTVDSSLLQSTEKCISVGWSAQSHWDGQIAAWKTYMATRHGASYTLLNVSQDSAAYVVDLGMASVLYPRNEVL